MSMERVGLDTVFIGEAYGFDAPTFLGYLAARTSRVSLVTGIVNVFSRTPALLAMTAAGLDAVSGGRAGLGLGASGPQLIEGFHGLPYVQPVARTREIIDICRRAWMGQPLRSEGLIPLPRPDSGARPLRLTPSPARADLPVYVGGLGERSVQLAAELADGWLSYLFVPERASSVWGQALAAGRAERQPSLGPLEIVAGGPAAVTRSEDEAIALRDGVRPQLALFVGGMGSRQDNFDNRLIQRYGFEDEARRVQDLYLDGRRHEAEAALSSELLTATSLIGSPGWLRDRLDVYQEAGVTCLSIEPVGEPIQTVEQFRMIVGD